MVSVRTDVATWTETDDGAVLVLDLRTSRYLSLNGSAALLWKRLVDGATPDELSLALTGAYGIDDERAGTDVSAFLADLRTRDLVS